MDVELVTEGLSEDENYMVNGNNAEFADFEGERCGICMDIVIDRGVLDCCQHWFCFTCIDNWATITNLCPLCQNEFQLITCVPVYDTTGSNKTDEDPYPRDDDWCIEGKNNTLSLPSYYIDENAVVCLEGDGCKVRSRSATFEADSVLDTSIACDSCDVWYHAFCVGFDSEGICENSWLCPRCVKGQMQETSDDDPVSRLSSHHGSENVGSNGSGEAAFLRKVSISVADAGETAIVLSLVDGNRGNAESSGLSTMDFITCAKVDALLPSSVSDTLQPGELSTQRMSSKPIFDAEELKSSLSQSMCFSSSLPSSSLAIDNGTEESSGGNVDLHPGLQVNRADDEITLGKEEMSSAGSEIPGAKRKHRDPRSAEAGVDEAEINTIVALKKVKVEDLEGNSQQVTLEDTRSISDDSEKILSSTETGNTESRCESGTKGCSADIMNIVQGTGHRRWKQSARTHSIIVPSGERENPAHLRVKKIMRRIGDDADSSILVQKLRKEIREAVCNKSTKEIGESLFDPKLLAAFRAVVSGPVTDYKKPPLDLKAKKAMLQKGKVRENLTKKIYGIGERRKRAWIRDCEVEFWKYRCSKISRPEKVQTLKANLDLLRNDTFKNEMKHGKEVESSSILSRLYLADTSVFPRKDDIRPVSALKDDAIPENKEQHSHQKVEKNALKDESSKKIVVPSQLESNVPKKGVSGLKTEAASTKSQSNNVERPLTSQLGGSKLASQLEMPGVSDFTKKDKRKWALELLARKTASIGSKEKEEESVMLKGNYPLLAQLPKDMRPVLAPIRHNKIPTAVRQAQLYRLATHFLRKANLPAIRVTAETELAIADAVNIEKEVANRSNSKPVYVNLCSQELSRRSDSMNFGGAETIPTSAVPFNGGETSDNPSNFEVNEALKMAGLSDTPPSSPAQLTEQNEDSGFSNRKEDDGPDNVFEMDSQPELDIYGDFEYNLEDDDFIGANALRTSDTQPESSRMKVLFSTHSKSNGSPNITDHEGLACNKPIPSFSGHERPTETGRSEIDSGANHIPLQSIIADEDCGELSLAECEELYGPDKEPLVQKYPETAVIKPYEEVKDIGVGNGFHGNCEPAKVSDANQDVSGSANSPSREKVQSKEKNSTADSVKQSDRHNFVSKAVEAYIKEHIRPLCKSGVISVEQYRWAVGKTTEKVMKFHSKEKNANFLIKEGEKVKKLAERYVETAQQTAKIQ